MEGIRGASATAGAIFIARITKSKEAVKDFIVNTIKYKLNFDYEWLVKNYKFNSSCQGTVPQVIFTFLISDSFEDSVRKAMTIGGDSDTLTSINGAIAEAFYGIPETIKKEAIKRLD
ncbi:MAG: ADP-ribosylglycohydrolase family protein [Ignavibacteriales bacterium]|nr:ADP-ribosylglycohydrolase family protein [Ignavibacteriales bacterium]